MSFVVLPLAYDDHPAGVPPGGLQETLSLPGISGSSVKWIAAGAVGPAHARPAAPELVIKGCYGLCVLVDPANHCFPLIREENDALEGTRS